MSTGVNKARPVEEGIWLFIVADMFMFLVIFGTYGYERLANVEVFNAAQAMMDIGLATANTLILITSSWFVVLAVAAAEKHKSKATFIFLSLAVLCGAVFCVNKFIEYGAKLEAGITILTNDFFMFYYVITAMHFAHVMVGMIILTVMAISALKGAFESGIPRGLEASGVYWHMVDLLWVVIFPLLYLLR